MKKVLVGMSGGVDSSVCAYLLKKHGYDVEGVMLRLWDDDACERRAGHVGCCGKSAAEDAIRVCGRLSIPFSVLSMQDEFEKRIVSPFCKDYLSGRTPNPCIACNKYMKWEAMLRAADERGADYIATGHYASIIRTSSSRYAIKKSKDVHKDQTYVLYHLTQNQLKRTLFPLGGYDKREVRNIAEEIALPTASKRESQDICFIPDGDYGAFIERHVDSSVLSKEGDFVTVDGTVAGRHKGVYHYTYGQRKGLGIALGKPVFVCGIDAENNKVILGDNEDCFSMGLFADNISHMALESFDCNEEYIAKIRYSDKGSGCRVEYTNGGIKVHFLKPVRAITPGQAIVFYKDDVVMGGATITKAL